MSDIAVCLFAKAPRPGQAKTRLAPALGNRGAAALSRAFLLDALDTWSALPVTLLVAEVGEMDAQLASRIAEHESMSQGDGDLGQRMERVLQAGLKHHDIAMVVGSDIPGLGEVHVAAAIEKLSGYDAVLAPTEDGGFALLALRHCSDGLLANLPWSQENTLQATRARLEEQGLSVALLPEQFDIDSPSDLPRLSEYLQTHTDEMPHTRAFFASEQNHAISVIIPVLDEDVRLPGLLKALSQCDGFAEVIVVDGGSTDSSVAVASSFPGVQVVHSDAGRAIQMNQGARAAAGGTLLFLHADVQLPANASQQIQEAFRSGEYLAGAFRLRTNYDPHGRKRRWIKPLLRLADMRSHYSNLPYGDQALFVRAETFRRLGGFPCLPLFEDLAISNALHRLHPLKIVKDPVHVSGRRFQERPFYYLALMNSFPLLYRLGVSPDWLARFYWKTR